MRYENLQQMIRASSSARLFLLSLPVEQQLALHQQGAYLHTADELRRRAGELAAYGNWAARVHPPKG